MINGKTKVLKTFIKNNKLKLLLTFILITITLIYFQSIDWDILFSNIPNLRMEFFYISSIFAIGAFTADAIIWYCFLKPLSPSEIRLNEIIPLNYFSVMAGVIIPSGGAVDVAIKLKYVKESSSLSYEQILATVLAVRIIFIVTLYPTMALLSYILVQFNIVTLEVAFGLTIFSFLILTFILGLLILMIANVDFFNRVLFNFIFSQLKFFLSGISVIFLTLNMISLFILLNLIIFNILNPFNAIILVVAIIFILRLGFLLISLLNPSFYQKSFLSKKFTVEALENVELKVIKSSSSLAVSFRLLKGSKKYWHLILLNTIIFWVLRLLTMYYIFLVLRDFEFHVIIVTATIGSFTTMIPAFLPGMVGIRDIIVTETLTILSEITKEDNFLTSAMNQVQTLILFLISLVGFFFIQKKTRKLLVEEK
jgi:hypothetical protein